MAEIVGFLKQDATYGEQQTLNLLKRNLPKEYTVYVETPIHRERAELYPDFVILSNYGVTVLEVKDWVIIEKADPHGGTVRTRGGESRREGNPVFAVRQKAIALSQALEKRRKGTGAQAIPWSYAVVMFNLPGPVITQLQRPWGEEFVLGKADLENTDWLLDRLKKTFTAERMRPLLRAELDHIRATIYPVVEIEPPGREAFILDQQQEKIVAEPLQDQPPEPALKPGSESAPEQQPDFFSEPVPAAVEAELPEKGRKLTRNVSIRLVRGFSGSGKTLVLTQRARFLKAQFPDWNIAVLTYNHNLQQVLEASFTGTDIRVNTFHSICKFLARPVNPDSASLKAWLKEEQPRVPFIREFGVQRLEQEIDWLRDMGLDEREPYLAVERRGTSVERRLTAAERAQVFSLYERYRDHLRRNNLCDWQELPLRVLEGLRNGTLAHDKLDAILVDEAQDWAPIWFSVLRLLLEPRHGLLFLADDPSQSIFRYYSWKEKGVHVAGRTRWLRVPYRNTYQIYAAAYAVIADHDEIQSALAEEGELVRPQLTPEEMRSGPKPLIFEAAGAAQEQEFIRNTIESLRGENIRDGQIAVLGRYKKDLQPIEQALRGCEVRVNPIHGFKGLEMDVVFIPALQKTINHTDDEAVQRRMIYMAMSRARSRLYMSCTGRLPALYQSLHAQGLVDLVR
jgi:hypothetical protein